MRRHGHGAVLADAAQVVAAQVHQHDVLGALLGIGQQFVGEVAILLGLLAAPACAGDRVQRGDAVLEPHMHLRAGADDAQRLAAHAGNALKVQEEHVGRRVEHAQRPVDRERVGVGGAA